MSGLQVFEGLTKSEISRIVQSGMICPLEGGKLLFRKGETGREMFVILKGKIDIIDECGGKRSVVAQLGPGEIFGEMAIFDQMHTRSTHAVVVEPSQVLVLCDDVLDELRDKKLPEQFLLNIIRVLCHRLRKTNSMYMLAHYGDRLAEVKRSAAQR